MGPSHSTMKQLSEVITNISMDVMVSQSTTADSDLVQSQIINLSGNTINTNLSAKQTSTISLEAISDIRINAKIQAAILNKLVSEITKKDTNFPEITKKKTEMEISSIVRNNIKSSFSIKNIASISMKVKNTQGINASGNSVNTGIHETQESSGIGKLVNKMSSNIAQDLASGTDMKNTQSQETTDFIANTIKSVGDAIGGVVGSIGNSFGIDPQTTFLFIVMVIAGAYIASTGIDAGYGMPYSGIGPPPEYHRRGENPRKERYGEPENRYVPTENGVEIDDWSKHPRDLYSNFTKR